MYALIFLHMLITTVAAIVAVAIVAVAIVAVVTIVAIVAIVHVVAIAEVAAVADLGRFYRAATSNTMRLSFWRRLAELTHLSKTIAKIDEQIMHHSCHLALTHAEYPESDKREY
jgi:hypothetical protein